MNKKTLIITLVVTGVLSLATIIGTYSMTSAKYNVRISEKESEQSEMQQKIDTLKNDKDTNNHLPSDVVKFFVNDVKSGEVTKAKLYLISEKQEIEALSFLDLDVNIDEMIIKDVSYEKDTDGMTVKLSYGTTNDDVNSVKYFNVVMIDSVWKISEVREG